MLEKDVIFLSTSFKMPAFPVASSGHVRSTWPKSFNCHYYHLSSWQAPFWALGHSRKRGKGYKNPCLSFSGRGRQETYKPKNK